MVHYITAYAVTAVAFLAIDYVWLARIAKPFYFSHMGTLLRERPNFGAAAAFYAVYVIGIVVFAVVPGLSTGSAMTALLYGALFGFFAYGTYDMTNYATLRDWPLIVSIVDIVWGTCLTAAAALVGFWGASIIAPAGL